MKHVLYLASFAASLGLIGAAAAEDSFAKKVGDAKAADLKPAAVYDVPFLTWGGDVATFYANGGDKVTKGGTLLDKHGLKVNLVNGDDFPGQVKNYLSGKTPYLRGTMSQIGQASEVLSRDPRTKPVVFLQLTWSAGDHMVARSTVPKINDLKGKKVALQWGGPHVGMFDDVLRFANLKWSDVTVIWTDDVTGPKGPAEKFRQDKTIDACFAITPDMVDLTSGGFEEKSTRSKVGDGSEKSVKGAKVIATTLEMSNCIADVYAVRQDFYDKNKPVVEKFAAAYLKASEELVEMRDNREAKDANKALADKYKVVLKMTQDIYGKETIPRLRRRPRPDHGREFHRPDRKPPLLQGRERPSEFQEPDDRRGRSRRQPEIRRQADGIRVCRFRLRQSEEDRRVEERPRQPEFGQGEHFLWDRRGHRVRFRQGHDLRVHGEFRPGRRHVRPDQVRKGVQKGDHRRSHRRQRRVQDPRPRRHDADGSPVP